MRRPTPQQLSVLAPFERAAFEVCDLFNRNPLLKRWGHSFLRTAGAGWVHLCTRNLLHVQGWENLANLKPDRGVVLACNHNSFFDLYVVSCVLLRTTSWIERMYFPVRSNYFYERPDGIAVNAVMAALSMYPPVMRDGPKRIFNQYMVDVTKDLLVTPGTLVGMHPEGTRNKSGDPYSLQPAKPGIGQIVHAARPIVLPVFVTGLCNDLPKQVRGNFDRTGEPITLTVGKPTDLSRFYNEPALPRTYQRIAEATRDELCILAERDREFRERRGWPVPGPVRRKRSLHAA